MTPHPDEIAAVLAAPEAVREALRRCEGPGWGIDAQPPFDAERPGLHLLAEARDCGFPWLPVDPCAIAAEAARLKSYALQRITVARDTRGWWAGWPHARWRAPSARLAALRLLVAVVGS